MDLTTFATQLEQEFEQNTVELTAQFPSELETEHGIEPTLDWGEFIFSRIAQKFPGLGEDDMNELLEDVRDEMCV